MNDQKSRRDVLEEEKSRLAAEIEKIAGSGQPTPEAAETLGTLKERLRAVEEEYERIILAIEIERQSDA